MKSSSRYLFALASLSIAHAQSSCSALLPSGSIRPSIASGYQYQVVATGLAKPRGILLDGNGNLLVVESGSGRITAHTVNDHNGCVTLASSSNVTDNIGLNHGIALSTDGKTLYGSTPSDVFMWNYDASAKTISNKVTVVDNMATSDHTTRTLVLSRKVPGMLVVGRGSTSNIDFEAASLDSGHSQIKAFQLNDRGSSAYDFNENGTRLGWGLRNDVGIVEHPNTGGIWSVENSADQLTRMGVDIHENNPAEELNYLGFLNGTTTATEGGNFGYPWCFTAWDPTELPDNSNITVGTQFAIDASTDSNNENKTDAYCSEQVAPRLAFHAHMAPLDIKFNNSGNQAWITFHGSWDRTEPVGYKLSVVAFANGQPVDASTSTTAATDIFSNADLNTCPNNCFRPVGMAIDGKGRIYVSSDSSGEIYLVSRTSSSSSTTSSPSTPTSSSTSTTSSGAAAVYQLSSQSLVASFMALLLMLF